MDQSQSKQSLDRSTSLALQSKVSLLSWWRMSATMTIITTRQEMFIPTHYSTRNCTFNILHTQPTTVLAEMGGAR